MNKRVGVITQYYKSLNFGGVLQAYALCKVLENEGYHANQLLIEKDVLQTPRKHSWYEYFNLIKIFRKLVRSIDVKRQRKLYAKLKDIELQRRKVFESFYEIVPHSRVVLQSKIEELLVDYDVFITGSDQVWSCGEIDSPYFLRFVPQDKKKISYAASLGKTKIDPRLDEVFKNELDKFNAISVREKDAVDLLKPYTNKSIVWCLDPTLLLAKEEWELIASDRKIGAPYMLCYFLGDDKAHRKIAMQYAKKHGLQVVTFPHYPINYHRADERFGDIRLTDASPQDFLALIKNADIVFTDSFHASVFSWHFQKEFFTFGRKKHKGMAARLYSLMDLLDLEGRFIEEVNKNTLIALESIASIDYTRTCETYQEMKKISFDFLRKNLDE